MKVEIKKLVRKITKKTQRIRSQDNATSNKNNMTSRISND